MKGILEREREALIAFYKAAGGDNWTHKDNWCSDKPVSEWYGIETNNSGRVNRIALSDNQLTGSIPESIGNLTSMEFLCIRYNQQLTGSIPESIGNLTKLTHLDLKYNQLTGSIPESIGNLTKLIDLSLTRNQLAGSIPESIGNLTKLIDLRIEGNQLTGSIPESIGNLTSLKELWLNNNQLTGSIPKSIGNLTKLIDLYLPYNQLTGSIPESIGYLTSLRVLSLSENQLTGSFPEFIGNNLTSLEELFLSWNQLTGSVPESIGNLTKLIYLYLEGNQLAGSIPKSVMQLDCWPNQWSWILYQRGEGFSKEGLIIPAPKFLAQTSNGGVLGNSIYAENKYTILYHFYDWCPYSNRFTPKLAKLYAGYKDKGLDVVAFSDEGTKEYYDKYAKKFNTKWQYILLQNDAINHFRQHIGASPNVDVVDENGYIVFNHAQDDYEDLETFLLEKLGEPNYTDPDFYESTDYSKDGEVKQLQKATKGDGIDIVLMGDAYTDRLIANGTYDQTMQTAMEKFFEVEPYKSFRDHFNVYSVTAVSKNEVYTNTSETAFAGYFGAGTEVGGNDQRAFYYAKKAIGEERMDDALVVVMMNSTVHAGTCYMYSPSNGDWGSGASVSYFPVGVDENALAQVLHHEAGGHGFSKLGDEYAYENMGAVPEWEITSAKEMAGYGWWRNIDFTSDPMQVKWSHFLNDTRYANDGLGVYEGAFTYWTGVWRPTVNSIMNTNVGGFNAPSREAIYYRIHKLAYGADWQYDYEEFVEWDARNRVTTTRGVPYRLEIPKDFKPLHPPVVVKSSWRNAKNNAPTKNVTRSIGNNVAKPHNAKSQISLKPMTEDESMLLYKDFMTKTIKNK